MPSEFLSLACVGCGVKVRCPVGRAGFTCPKCGAANAVRAAPPAPLSLDDAPAADDEAPDPGMRLLAWLGVGLAGLVAGGLVAVMLSAFKPDIGLGGQVTVAAVGAAALAGVLAVRAFLGLGQTFVTGGTAAVTGHVRKWSGTALLFGVAGFAPCAALVVAEVFGPPEGYVKQFVDRRRAKEEQAAQAADEARRAAEKKDAVKAQAAWSSADLVLAQPGSRLVALRTDRSTSPRFTVLGKAADDQVADSLMHVWDARVPVVRSDPTLVRRVFDKYQAGQSVEYDDSTAVDRVTRFNPLVPAGGSLVTFVDAASKLRRTGHVLKTTPAGFTFSELVPRADPAGGAGSAPFRTESVARAGIIPGSEVASPGDSQLRQSTDFLDYAVYNVLSRLQADHGPGGSAVVRPCVFADAAVLESVYGDRLLTQLRRELKGVQTSKQAALEGMLDRDGPEYQSRYATGWAAILMVLGDHVRERQQQANRQGVTSDLRREHDAETARLQGEYDAVNQLLPLAKQVDRDVNRLFTQAGVPLVDRTERTRGIYCDKLDGKQWLRPAADVAVGDGLVMATHILLPEVSRPTAGGAYHLGLRLVEVKTGRIIWADDGDRIAGGSVLVAAPAAPPPVSVAGRWRCREYNFRVEVTETDKAVRVSLQSHDALTRFELYGTRSGNQIQVTTCFVVYNPALRYGAGQHQVRATMEVIDGGAIAIACQRPIQLRADGSLELSADLNRAVFERE